MKSELNIWYMDDGTLGGDVGVLLEDLEIYLFIYFIYSKSKQVIDTFAI